MWLENAKSGTTRAEKKKLADVISTAGLPQLDTEKTTLYRSLVPRGPYRILIKQLQKISDQRHFWAVLVFSQVADSRPSVVAKDDLALTPAA